MKQQIGNAMLLTGDCLEVLRSLPECFRVNCCVTSPPYYGLRDYGTAKWEGGSVDCDHKQARGGLGAASAKQVSSAGASTEYQFRDVCGKCGAKRVDNQIGLEQTPDEYVARLVEVFREVRRVLADDGTLWLNIGDSYGAAGGDIFTGFNERWDGTGIGGGKQAAIGANAKSIPPRETGLRPKNLLGIPWRVAFALQADGWYLRQDIIWAKPNPMPESVKDRCTKAHEYIFLLTKSARYWYDAEEIAEPATYFGVTGMDGTGYKDAAHFSGKHGRASKDVYTGVAYTTPQSEPRGSKSNFGDYATRNRRSVWTVATQPYAGAHFATFPPALIEPCILAGCPAGGTVLDPFSGSGTTGQVALQQGRKYLGIELNPEYQALAVERITPHAAQERLFA